MHQFIKNITLSKVILHLIQKFIIKMSLLLHKSLNICIPFNIITMIFYANPSTNALCQSILNIIAQRNYLTYSLPSLVFIRKYDISTYHQFTLAYFLLTLSLAFIGCIFNANSYNFVL